MLYTLWMDRVIGNAKEKRKLLHIYGSAEELYKRRESFRLDGNLAPDKQQEQYMQQYNIKVVSFLEDQYPALLKEIQNPPFCLYCRGDLSLFEKVGVAVVGARKASDYGRRTAFQLGKFLAQWDIPIISGMAEGADAEAHRGSLLGGGNTVAVLGCGVDVCYPACNRKLMEEIQRAGIVISEFPPGTLPRPYHFPLRNRIISGLSRAVIVVEAGEKSGSLITAEFAGEQGRDVMAVPGNIDQKNSLGCNRLIQDGAYPIAQLKDVAEQLQLRPLSLEKKTGLF